jgi:hypothetical protein
MSNAQLLSTNKPLIQTASQATTSGTSKDFTGIPSWVERITVVFSGVSTNRLAREVFRQQGITLVFGLVPQPTLRQPQASLRQSEVHRLVSPER